MTRRPTVMLAFAALFVGCATGEASDEPGGGPRDTSVGADVQPPTDSTPESAPPIDSEIPVDSSLPSDSGTSDASADTTTGSDTGTVDSATVDSATVDSGSVDTGAPDTKTDTGAADTGTPDTGTLDTGAPDTGGTDAGTCTIALSYDLEASDQGFTHTALSGISGDDPWQRGTPSSTTIKCHGGTKCFTTGLTTNYLTCQTAQLSLPTLDLSGCAGSSKTVQLAFWHYYEFEPPTSSTWWDGGLLQVSTNGTTWTDVTTSQPYDGTIKGSYAGCSPVPLVNGHAGWSGVIPGAAWKQVTYDLGPAYRVAGLRFRFVFGSDEGTNKRGWFIDDVTVTSF